MQLTYHAKLVTASLCAVTMWMGASIVAAPVSADNDSASTPTTEAEASSEPSSTTYVVKPGDYLEAIADQHEINWPSIYEVNEGIENPDLIFPNQTLDIPSQDLPLTRSIAGSTLVVSESYAPQPINPTQATPQPAKSPTTLGSTSGVVGLGQVLGRPYVYGGTTMAGFDCSGLTQYMASLRGISLPRTVAAQYQATTRIGRSDLQPGDLVFFNWNHVGMYIGGNQIVHAANPSLGVRIDNLDVAIQYNGYLGAGALGR